MTPIQHQTFLPMPKLDAPMVNPDDTVGLPWYYFFVRIWQAIGGGNLSFQDIGILKTNNGSSPIEVLTPNGTLVATFQTGAYNPQETYLQIALAGAPATNHLPLVTLHLSRAALLVDSCLQQPGQRCTRFVQHRNQFL